MFQIAIGNEEINCAEGFVQMDFYNCPFLYSNLKKYGITRDNMKLYILGRTSNIVSVAYMYYDCLHFYYKEGFCDFSEVVDLISLLDPHKIFMPSYTSIKHVNIPDYLYKEVLVMAPNNYIDIDTSMVKDATIDDLPKIARFMWTEWGDAYESIEGLEKQLRERFKDKYGRTKYIEDNGEVVACVSSYAELDDFSVCGGLLVSDSQRGKKLGSVMVKSIYKELEDEGKRPCGLIVEDYSRIFHEKNGFSIVGKMNQYYKNY